MRYTIRDFQEQFDTDEKCLDFIFRQRWPDGGVCVCGKTDCFHPVKGRKSYACAWCGTQISPTADTIFHKSPTSLRFWFFAMFLMTASKNGVAAKELERQIGVTYKCAWRMAHQIRKLMDIQGGLLWGTVEADETFIGGRVNNMHERRKAGKNLGTGGKGKAVIAGLMEKNGEVRARVVSDTRGSTLLANMVEFVEPGSTVHTDESVSYSNVKHVGYIHAQVNHGDHEYVRAEVHTNGIEGFWSQLKRSIHGTFHQVSKKHLQAYVDEFVYRYNRRKLETPLFHDLSGKVGRVSRDYAAGQNA
jgi:transposase